jgi:transposase
MGHLFAASVAPAMLNLSAATRVFVATAPVDLRGSFNRLFALTQAVLLQDPLSGHWFVFTNRQRNRVKVLFWDGSGLWVCAKRLERGRFTWPDAPSASASLRSEELSALLSGLEVQAKANWYRR